MEEKEAERINILIMLKELLNKKDLTKKQEEVFYKLSSKEYDYFSEVIIDIDRFINMLILKEKYFKE